MEVLNRHHLVNGWPEGAVYIGRGTPLGNPFPVGPDFSRSEALEAYRIWLYRKIDENDPAVLTALFGLNENSSLICSCAPAPCHGDIVIEAWVYLKMRQPAPMPIYHDNASSPKDGEIFVFGSNLAGLHSTGHALLAKEAFGAQPGKSEGLMGAASGQSFAVPVRDERMRALPEQAVRASIGRFIQYARDFPNNRFHLSRVGCDAMGYRNADIAPMFRDAPMGQCSFPIEWKPHLQPGAMTYAGIGARKTPADVLLKMTRIARRLEANGYLLRSGAAIGADSAFETGATRKEIFLPSPGYNGHPSPLHNVCDAAMSIANCLHPAFGGLSPKIKLLMARNGYQILGQDLRSPVDFVVCYTTDGVTDEARRTRATGGTGQAIALASRWNIPVFNLANPDAIDRLGDFIKNQKTV